MGTPDEAAPELRDFADVETRKDMDEAAGDRYEHACLDALREWIPHRVGQMRAAGREPDDPRLEGERPETRLVAPYRDRSGQRRALSVELWGPGQVGSSNPAHLANPRDIADIFTINLGEPGTEPGVLIQGGS